MNLVSLDEARRIAVRSQTLDGSACGVLDTVRRIGFLQIDPISTVAPPQQLVLWSRLGPYDLAELDRLLWEDRLLFEWNAFIWPIEHLPVARAYMRLAAAGTPTSAAPTPSSGRTHGSSGSCSASSTGEGRSSRARSRTAQ